MARPTSSAVSSTFPAILGSPRPTTSEPSPAWRLLAITGFLGGLTTFSTYSAEVVDALLRGAFATGVALALAHLAGSLVLTWLGILTYRALAA